MLTFKKCKTMFKKKKLCERQIKVNLFHFRILYHITRPRVLPFRGESQAEARDIYNHYSGTAPCVTLCSIVRRTWCRLSLDQHIAFCLFHADYWEYRAVDWYLLVIQNIIRDWGDSIQSWSCPTNGLTQSLYCDGNKERKYGV